MFGLCSCPINFEITLEKNISGSSWVQLDNLEFSILVHLEYLCIMLWTACGFLYLDFYSSFFELGSFVNCLQVHGNNNWYKWYGSCKVEKLPMAQYSGLTWSVKLNTQTLLHLPLIFKISVCRLHGMKQRQVTDAPGFPFGKLNLL
jgi:hypothetical protein